MSPAGSWPDTPPDLLDRAARALPGDMLVARGLGKMGERPCLLTKLPHNMGETSRVTRRIPCGALALVLGRHQEERLQDYLYVLCDDCLGWISPDNIDHFLDPEEEKS